MNSLEPSDVLALFRATSRKLFLPKFTFSALIVSKCTSSFRRLLSSDSIVVRPPNQGTGPLVTEGGPTEVSDINLLDERRSATQATSRDRSIKYRDPLVREECRAPVAARSSTDGFVPAAAHRPRVRPRRRRPRKVVSAVRA